MDKTKKRKFELEEITESDIEDLEDELELLGIHMKLLYSVFDYEICDEVEENCFSLVSPVLKKDTKNHKAGTVFSTAIVHLDKAHVKLYQDGKMVEKMDLELNFVKS